MVASGAFREDLYYRLNGVDFELLPLRQRSDIALLIDDVLAIEKQGHVDEVSISEDVMQILVNFSWPGNIRQLRNAMRYALAVCDNNIITCADLPTNVIGASTAKVPIQQGRPEAAMTALPASEAGQVVVDIIHGLSSVEQNERKLILESLQKHKWHIVNAAEAIGISRSSMYRKIEKYRIILPHKRPGFNS